MHTQIEPHSRPLRLFSSLLIAALLVVALAATASASSRHHHRHVSPDSAFELPPTGRCVRSGELTVELRRVHGVRWTSGLVKVNGGRFESFSGSQAGRPLQLDDLPAGRFVVAITVHGSGGVTVSVSRSYQSCHGHIGSGDHVGTTKQPPTPASPGNSTPTAPAPLQSGSYSGSFGSLYVSADSTVLQDVTWATVHLGCTPGGSPTDRIDIGEVPLNPDGSFNSVTTQHGILNNVPATFTYTLTGIGTDTEVSGNAREDVSYEQGGVSYSCTSGTWSWKMNRESQGTVGGPVPSGSYAGSFGTLYVSPDSKKLEDVTWSTFHLGCAPGGNPTDRVDIGEVAIEPDGSFDSVTTQHGILNGAEATFTYTLSGHFHGFTSSGAARIAGMAREDVTYEKGGSDYTCSSNNWSWAMSRESQGSQAGPPPSGSYSGSFGTLQVSPDSSRLLVFSFPTFHAPCAPDGELSSHFNISEVALQPDGSFATTVHTTETISGATANITYTLNGHFHGYSSSGVARIGGIAREDVVYTSGGVQRTCSSNNWSWAMSHP